MLTRENALLWVPILPFWMWLGAIRGVNGNDACFLLPVTSPVSLSFCCRWRLATHHWEVNGHRPRFRQVRTSTSATICNPTDFIDHWWPVTKRRCTNAPTRSVSPSRRSDASLSSREVSNFWARRSFEEIRQDPARWLQVMVVKCFMVVNRYEVPDVESMYVYRDYSWPLRLLGPLWHFGLLCPLAVWGLIATRAQWRTLWLYYLLILVMVAAVVLFFILGRYRQPLVPLLMLFAAAGALDIWHRIRAKRLDRYSSPVSGNGGLRAGL